MDTPCLGIDQFDLDIKNTAFNNDKIVKFDVSIRLC